MTSQAPKPNLPLPPPLCADQPGTWAHDTMSRRVDGEILERTFQDNRQVWESPPFETILEKFLKLRQDLQSNSPLVLLEDLPSDASAERRDEVESWNQILKPFVDRGENWLTAPWMVSEFYVYRRLMQAIEYWDPNSPGFQYDPFTPSKQAGLESSVRSAESMLAKASILPDTKEGLELAVSFALWGNRMDLSLWPADASHSQLDIFTPILEQASQHLLHDDLDTLADHCDKLRQKGGGNVDIIVDNAGFELITDLALAHYLISSGIASKVTFQVKSHPTFVSDALEKDLVAHVDHHASLDPKEYPSAQKAGVEWKSFLADGKWVCNADKFWVQGLAMWEMPENLRSDLTSRCDLAFVKGDANYRRLLGDLAWKPTDPFSEIVGCYFPSPVSALRTLKAEIGCGMDSEQVERAKGLDPNWQVNGRFGVVQFGAGYAAP
eukprot:Nitzschia sp. Nitz4//scaffold8_size234185//191279//192592//NITZ4_001289-RA/size234185-processed-gene-0.130-mRNA-1//1//CDS//3329559902//5989//frame0